MTRSKACTEHLRPVPTIGLALSLQPPDPPEEAVHLLPACLPERVPLAPPVGRLERNALSRVPAADLTRAGAALPEQNLPTDTVRLRPRPLRTRLDPDFHQVASEPERVGSDQALGRGKQDLIDQLHGMQTLIDKLCRNPAHIDEEPTNPSHLTSALSYDRLPPEKGGCP